MCASVSAKRTLVVSMSSRQTRLPLVRQRVNYSDAGILQVPIRASTAELQRPPRCRAPFTLFVYDPSCYAEQSDQRWLRKDRGIHAVSRAAACVHRAICVVGWMRKPATQSARKRFAGNTSTGRRMHQSVGGLSRRSTPYAHGRGGCCFGRDSIRWKPLRHSHQTVLRPCPAG